MKKFYRKPSIVSRERNRVQYGSCGHSYTPVCGALVVSW